MSSVWGGSTQWLEAICWLLPINKRRENNTHSLIKTGQETNYTEGFCIVIQHQQYVLMEAYSVSLTLNAVG
jgi:hypothetical protein